MKNINFKILAKSVYEVVKYLALWTIGLGIFFTVAKYMTVNIALGLIILACVCVLTYFEYSRQVEKKRLDEAEKNFLNK